MRTEWFWCLHCERAFQSEVTDDFEPGTMTSEVGQPYTDEGGHELRQCPYDGCDGSPLDFIHWSEYRRDHPGNPGTPEEGKVYPLYD